MKIKVISYGKNKFGKTAQIIIYDNTVRSKTLHVWHSHNDVYKDVFGFSYTL